MRFSKGKVTGIGLFLLLLAPLFLLATEPSQGARDLNRDAFSRLPGATIVQGKITPQGKLELTLHLHQFKTKNILAAKFYSEPSNTLLVAFVNVDASTELQKKVETRDARGMIIGTYDGAAPKFVISAPPAGDTRLRIDYVTSSADENVREWTAADALIGSFDSFGFGVAPDAGGGNFTFTCLCSGSSCGTIRCSTPAFTLCCPSCTCTCGYIKCP